jgi:hypothetical protein
MQWPRRLTGVFLGTPEKFTEATMMDVVRAIRETTGANVSLVEAKPNLAGTPWLEPSKNTAQASMFSGSGAGSAATAPATSSAPAATGKPATSGSTSSAPGASSTASTAGASKPNSVPR